MNEQFVAWIWQRQRVRGPLVCDDGRIVQVVYPGRSWGDGQPDFQGAIIAWPDGRIDRGDVEIHVAPRGWKQHGHQRDPAYGQVVLHVAMRGDTSGPTLNLVGTHVPTLLLEPHLSQSLDRLQVDFECDQVLSSAPCQTHSADVGAPLERAGLLRFGERADRLEGDLSVALPSDLLWRGVARALGYTRNAEPMTHLAERIPLSQVGALIEATKHPEPVTAIYAALLGSAGLLPSQRELSMRGLFAQALVDAWQEAAGLGRQVVLGGPRWETRRVRPGNHPVRRLAALAVLAVSFQHADPLNHLARIVLEDDHAAGSLVRYFEVRGPTREWGGLLDLDRVVEPPVAGLVGRDRAAEIVINAVLPLLHALGRYWDNRDLERASLEVYRTFPRIASNGLVRGMAEQIAGADGQRIVGTACQQQGLLHIFRTTCHAHSCEECILQEAGGQGLEAKGVASDSG